MPEHAGRDPRRLVFVDTEYDRLNTDTANVVEIAIAVEDSPVVAAVPPHTIDGHEAKALEINRYFERDLGDRAKWNRNIVDVVAGATAGQTIVAANPRCDARVLARLIGYEPWHYRLGDVESAAWLLLGFDHVPGLREIKDRLTELGYELPAPDHSAGGDVETMRAAFRIMQRIARLLLSDGVPTREQLEMFETPAPAGV
jgi:hypothetical protein